MEFSILPKWFQESNFPFGGDDDSKSGKTNGDGSSDGESNNQESQDNSEDGSKKTDDGKEQDDPADPYAGLSAKELKRLLSDSEGKAKTLETERDSYKTKVDDSEREKLDEKGRLELDLTNERENNAKLKSTNARLSIINAIIMDEGYQWHNPEMVAAQLNSEIVKVSDDGKVEGLKNELKRIAKDNDWMLKKQEQNNNKNGSTGFQPGQGGSNNGGNNGKPEAAALAKIMPALASRVNR